jgi:23S rRNA (uracil1939-C5)-methyltransferase
MKKRSSAPFAEPKGTKAPDAGPVTAIIEAMGSQGHGIARIGGQKVFVPFTLPAEPVRLARTGSNATAVAIESPSADRIAPLCSHFGTCGGCALQHWSEAPYRAWKAGLVASALARAGIDAKIEILKTYPVPSRRRATFTARNTRGHIQLGYLAERSHDIVDLTECPILLPEIAEALPAVRTALSRAIPPASETKVHIAAVANGLDCAVEGPPISEVVRSKVIEVLCASGFIRAAWNGDVLFLSAAPFIICGGVRVPLPAGAFLQAVEACERDVAGWVIEALRQAKAAKSGPICDLFSGLGAFAFPAAKITPVTAYEENASAVEAILSAAKQAKGLKPLSAVRRDLFRNPIGPLELKKFVAVIMDPPREGAEAQCCALAASKIADVAMVSCNPATFARDAAILTAGGFQLTRLIAFDQFRFSAHVEIAALFRRPSSKKRVPAPSLKR